MVQRVMVKGVSRQIILVESPDPNLFEKAIFILKDGRCGAGAQELLEEASASPTAISGSISAPKSGVPARCCMPLWVPASPALPGCW